MGQDGFDFLESPTIGVGLALFPHGVGEQNRCWETLRRHEKLEDLFERR